MPKKILSISPNAALRTTSHIMLQNQRFEVVSVANARETHLALRSGDFDLVILGVAVDAKAKREIASSIRKSCEHAQILELCRISPEIPDAEHHLIGAEPEDVDQTVRRILKS